MAAGTGSDGRGQGEATGDGVAPKLHLPAPAAFGRGVLGLAAASAAITMAVCETPPWLDRNAYFVAVSGAFFAGMAEVIASVRAGHGAGSKVVVLVLVVVAAGLTAASLLL